MRRVFILLLCCFVLTLAGRGPSAAVAAATEMTTRSVAILDFENANKEAKEDDWLSAGMAETLITKLRQVRDLRLVERKQILKAMEELDFTATDFFDTEKSEQLARFLKVDVLLVGGFQHYAKNIRITARFVDVSTGEVLEAVDIKGKMDDIFDLQDELALKLIQTMGIETTRKERKTVTKQPTTNLNALELFSKALEAEDEEEKVRLLKQAIEADPDYKEAYNDLAVVYMDRGDYDEAIGYLNEAVRVDATYFLPHFNLGVCYNQLGRAEESVKAFKRAIEYNDTYVKGFLALSETYYAQGEYRRAGDAAREAIELDPSNPDAYNDLGNALYGLERYEDSIKQYEQAIELDAEAHYAYHNIASASEKLGDTDKALAYYGKALEINPDYAISYFRRAALYHLTLNDPHKAALDYITYIEHEPKDFDGYMGLARVYVLLDKPDEAKEAYEQALELRGDEPNALNELANVYYNDKDYERAERLYLAALEADPDFKWGYFNLGNLYAYVRSDPDTAADYYEKAYRLDRQYTGALVELTLLEVRRSEWDDAIGWLMRGIKLTPDDAFWSYYLGYAYDEKATQKRNEGKTRIAERYMTTAEKHLLEAARLDPDNADTYNLLGNLRLNNGEAEQAVPHYEKALELNKDHQFATVNLASAMRSLERYEDAETYFKRTLEIAPDYAFAVHELAELYDEDLDRPEDAVTYYKRYLDLVGEDEGVQDRIEELSE